MATSAGVVLSVDDQWRLIAATPRVVGDARANAFGSAAVIDANDDELVLLTAEHLVRTGQRSYEFFSKESHPNPAATLSIAESVKWSSKSTDLAIVKIPIPKEMKDRVWSVIPIAAIGERPKLFPFDAFSIGCTKGAAPSVSEESVISKRVAKRDEMNMAFFWESNLEPQSGRSGGPLISADGKLIGLCAAATNKHGYYTHLDEIQVALKKNGYKSLVPQVKK